MRISLVYPPFCWPAAMPLGLPYLKGYLSRHNPSVDVELVDLNVGSFTRQRFPPLCEQCDKAASLDCLPLELFSRTTPLRKAVGFFQDSEAFSVPARYLEHNSVLNAYSNQLKTCFEQFLLPFLATGGKQHHPMVAELLQPDVERILHREPNLVGFSANASQISYALALAHLLKEQWDGDVVLGGYFASCYDAREILQAFPSIDYVVSREGEQTLSQLLDSLPAEDRNLDSIGNLAFRRREEIVVNEPTFIHDLDEIPQPDFDGLPPEDYLSPSPVFPILYSRGCYWKRCAFCAHHENYAERYRVRSVDSVVDEIERRVADHGARYFLFCDEQITGRDLNRLAEALLARGLDIAYGLAGFRPSNRVTREQLETAHRSGCRWLYLGVESLSQRLLDLMSKGTQVESILNLVRWAHEVGIKTFVSAFWGFPTQTAEEVRAEAELYREHQEYLKLPDDGGQFYLVKNADVHLHPERYQVEVIDIPPSLTTPTGQVTSIAPRYRRLSGLEPAAAQQLYRATLGDDVPYEAGGFWSHLVLLADLGVELVFPRRQHREALAQSLAPLCRELLQASEDPPADENQHALTASALGKVHAHLGAIHERSREHEQALTHYRRALEQRPAHPELQGRLGRTLHALKRYPEALDAALRAVAKQPDNAALYHLIGKCHEEMGDQPAAVEAYRKARALSPRKGLARTPLDRLRALARRPRLPKEEG